MIDRMREMLKLRKYLKDNGYIFAHTVTPAGEEGEYNWNQIEVFDENDERVWDVICHKGSYGYSVKGYDIGLLEAYGEIVNDLDPDHEENSVIGFLTADDIIKVLEKRKNS